MLVSGRKHSWALPPSHCCRGTETVKRWKCRWRCFSRVKKKTKKSCWSEGLSCSWSWQLLAGCRCWCAKLRASRLDICRFPTLSRQSCAAAPLLLRDRRESVWRAVAVGLLLPKHRCAVKNTWRNKACSSGQTERSVRQIGPRQLVTGRKHRVSLNLNPFLVLGQILLFIFGLFIKTKTHFSWLPNPTSLLFL